MSRTLTLFIACLGWGALVEFYHFIQQRVRARRLTSA